MERTRGSIRYDVRRVLLLQHHQCPKISGIRLRVGSRGRYSTARFNGNSPSLCWSIRRLDNLTLTKLYFVRNIIFYTLFLAAYAC